MQESIRINPTRWCDSFDIEVRRNLWADVTGGPWSLHEYVLRRMPFTARQEDLERTAHILAALHSTHMRGPEAHALLGAQIRQAFKAVEQAARDGADWTLPWLWVGQPDPRPGRFSRSFTDAAEYSAGIGHLRVTYVCRLQ